MYNLYGLLSKQLFTDNNDLLRIRFPSGYSGYGALVLNSEIIDTKSGLDKIILSAVDSGQSSGLHNQGIIRSRGVLRLKSTFIKNYYRITTGDNNDKIATSADFTNFGLVRTKRGKDKINVEGVLTNLGKGKIFTGDDDDSITAGSIVNHAKIRMDEGVDTIKNTATTKYSVGIQNFGKIHTGEGDSEIMAIGKRAGLELRDGGKVIGGGDNDKIDDYASAHFPFSAEHVYSAGINVNGSGMNNPRALLMTRAGDDKIATSGYYGLRDKTKSGVGTLINMGAGEDSFTATGAISVFQNIDNGLTDRATVMMGDGDDKVDVVTGKLAGIIDLGHGDDIFMSNGDGGWCRGGAGIDKLLLDEGTYIINEVEIPVIEGEPAFENLFTIYNTELELGPSTVQTLSGMNVIGGLVEGESELQAGTYQVSRGLGSYVEQASLA
jgi:hypothetical protein